MPEARVWLAARFGELDIHPQILALATESVIRLGLLFILIIRNTIHTAELVVIIISGAFTVIFL